MKRSTREKRPMGCMKVGRLLQRYLDGVLDEPRSLRLAAHLEDCRRCGLEAQTYERIKASLSANGHGPLPADAVARLTDFAQRLSRGEDPNAT